MKTLIPLMITVAAGYAAHADPAFAPPVPPPPPDEDVLFFAQARAPEALPSPPVAPVPPAAPRPMTVRAEAGWGGPFMKGSSRSSRTLVIPQGEFSPEKLGDAEEDLNVMAHILEKSVERRSDDEKPMGIDLLTSSSSGIKNLLIEGHGAIFMLKTKIALLPPPEPKKQETKTKESTTSSEWEEAREHIYGPSDIEKHIHKTIKHATMSFSRSEEYDKDKVQRLKDSLTDALKNASNIRQLKDNETVTVVVTSSSSSTYVREVRDLIIEESQRGGGGGGGRGGEGGRGGGRVYMKDVPEDKIESRSGARLLLQARKSDVDAYAKGKLTSDAFREKVKIQIY